MSFIFEPLYDNTFTPEDLLAFRKYLGISVREFVDCFEFSQAAITRVKVKHASGRIHFFIFFKSPAAYSLKNNWRHI